MSENKRGPKSKFSDKTWDEVVTRSKNGESSSQIAKIGLGPAASTIRTKLRKLIGHKSKCRTTMGKKDGKVIFFDSLKSAARATGGSSEAISAALRNGSLMRTGWRFEYPSNITDTRAQEEIEERRKEVLQMHSEGESVEYMMDELAESKINIIDDHTYLGLNPYFEVSESMA